MMPSSRFDFRSAPPVALDTLQSVDPVHLTPHGFGATTAVFGVVRLFPTSRRVTLVVSVRVAQGAPVLSSHVFVLAFGVFPDDFGFAPSSLVDVAAFASTSFRTSLPMDLSAPGYLPGLLEPYDACWIVRPVPFQRPLRVTFTRRAVCLTAGRRHSQSLA